MTPFKLGVRLESLGLPLRKALQQAASMGVLGVQADALGDLAPGKLSETGRREFRHLLRGYNLEVTAVGCPLRRGLDVAEDLQPRIEHIRKVMSLAFDLGPRRVVIEAGRVPEDVNSPGGTLMTQALGELALHGDRIGVTLALETGLELGAEMRKYLDRFDTGSLGVNLDPANLVISGFDLLESVRALQGKIVHTHAKDASRSRVSRTAQEVPVGHGDIDWMAYLDVLREVEYNGWLTVERETGDNRVSDVATGVAFLRRFLPA